MTARSHHNTLYLGLREIGQLFNSMDPSPFLEKDLDPDAEKFIFEWASEPRHRQGEFQIHIHLEKFPEAGDPKAEVAEAIHHFFRYQSHIERGVFRQLMRDAQVSLVIGLVFITACLMGSRVLSEFSGNSPFLRAMAESLVIAGWVGMWRPIQIGLYEWWPIRRRIGICDRLARAVVEVRHKATAHPG
jgi:hypothetical protein